MAGRFSVEAVFKAVDRVTAPVTRMQNRVSKFTRSMSRGFNKLNRSVGQFSQGIKRGAVTVAAALAVTGVAMASVIGTGANFEQAITDVGAVSLKTRDQIASLEKQALSLGRTTKFTATEAANAMEVLSRAGFSTNDVLQATPAILSAAAASGLDIADVANHVSNVLKGMGLATSEAARVSDVLALASARTNSSIGSLGESMKNVASTARQLNVPLEDAVASVALLQDVGLDASVAGSAFNVMMTKMAAPSAKISKIMRRLGLSFKDAKGDMKPLPQVLDDLNKASKKMGGNFDQVAFLAELVGLRGQKAASNLGRLFETGKLKTLTKELKNAKGSADKMAAIRMDTFSGSMLLLGSAIDAVKVKIFGMNEGPLKKAVDRMTAWVSANEKLISSKIGGFLSSLINNFGTIVKWMKRIGIGIAVFFALAAILKTLALVLTVVNLVMAANPIVLIILGIVALIAAIAAVIIWWDELVESFKNSGRVMSAVTGFIGALLGPIGMLISSAALIFKAWEPMKDFFADLWGGIISIFDASIERITSVIDKIKNAVAAITGTVSAISDTAGSVVSGIGEGISSAASSVGSLFGFGGDDEDKKSQANTHVISPQDRIAKSIDEKRTTSTSEVTIRDESGRAEVTGGKMGPGLSLQRAGAF